jgi:uncharacterized membrane protein
MQRLLRRVGNIFVTGLLAILPLYLTVVAVQALFNLVDASVGRWVGLVTGHQLPGAGVAATILVVFFLGLVVSRIGLVQFGSMMVRIANRVPGLGRLYRTISAFLDPLARPETRPFREAVWVDFAGGLEVLGFLTSPPYRDTGEGDEKVNVYLPMSHPYVGYVISVPAGRTRRAAVAFEEVISYHISCGSALPGRFRWRSDDTREPGGLG